MAAAVNVAYEHGAATSDSKPRTLFEKVWHAHLVHEENGQGLIYIDRHLVHETTSPQAFEGLRLAGRKVRRPDCTLATVDHNIPTDSRKDFKDVKSFIKEHDSRNQVATLEENVIAFGLRYFGMDDNRQGIVHVVGPEQGFTLPGTTVVCGDSHTSTHGAFGALAFGIGTSEVEHVMATQTLIMKQAKNLRVTVSGKLAEGVGSKDLVLHLIGILGTAGGTGYVVEFAGSVVEAMSMESRMAMCNMTIEGGARAGMVAPDQVTFDYLKGRPLAPKGSTWEKAVAYWKSLCTDEGAVFDKEIFIDAEDIAPTVTWGSSPEDVVPINGAAPDPAKVSDETKKNGIKRALEYMGLQPGQKMADLTIDKCFIGSCTNSRMEDLRSAAAIARGRKVAEGVYAMVVPGSGLVKSQAEAEGLDKIFKEAGFDWREPGCSMCLGMNPDRLKPKERCASTSNRNFEGRQGPQGRTHLMSPAMAAAAAVTGKLTDIRTLSGMKAKDKKIIVAQDSKKFCKQSVVLPEPDPEQAPGGTKAQNAGGGGGAGMAKFVKLESAVTAPLRKANVDTDCIVPKQFLKTIKRTGLGAAAFFELRYEDDGVTEIPSFVLNKPEYRKATAMITMENFGCGSSREHAPWALNDFGIRCIIAPSFADIFFNNCFKNSMLPITLPKDKVEELMKDAESLKKLTIDLPEQNIIREDGSTMPFDVEPFRKHCLINGLDDIGLTMQKSDLIGAYESKRSDLYPWLVTHAPSGEEVEVRVTASKSASFYANIVKGFLVGLPATEDRPARAAVSLVTLSATGAAVERAVRAALEVQQSGEAAVARMRTDYIATSNGGEARLPQVTVTLETTPKAKAIIVAKAAADSKVACSGGCGSDKKTATDF